MIYYFDDCALDTNLFTLQRGGKNTRLRLKVFRMCLYLLEHRDRVVSREELCTQVWPGQFVSQATLEGVIRLVRQAVGDNGRTQNVIQTLHGHGYRFVASVRAHPLSETGEEGIDTAAFHLTLEKDDPPGGADIPAGMVAVLEAEDPLSLGQPKETQPRTPETNAQKAESLRNIDLEERCGAHPRGRSGWRMSRVGIALTLVTLVVLGGWALVGGVRAPGTAPLDKSRIAVLPFIDLSAEADQAYFADGLTENLIAELARINGLTVIARTSVMQYKGSLKDVATIGRELRVGTIVEGSIRRVDNQLRISAQLIDVASQGHLWSQEYEPELTGVFGIHSDIATRVAQWFKVQATAGHVNDCLRALPPSTAVVQKN